MFAAISRSESAVPNSKAGSPGPPRSVGAVRIAFLGVGTRTALADLHQQGCMKARLPRSYDGDPLTAILINTAGGLTGGDDVETTVEWGAGAQACFSTQAAERIYRSSGGAALIRNRLTAGAGAAAEWLPQETILFDAGRFRRETEVDLDPHSRFLAVESVVLGRKAMGETIRTGMIADRWSVRVGGRLVWLDAFRLEDDLAAQIARPAVLAGAGAYATVIAQASGPDAVLAAIREGVGADGGASRRGPLVVGRVTAPDGDALRLRLAALIPALRRVVTGQPARLPRVFRI
ncbi:urease accessory protein UreD [Minwuia thermotolerans]|uniref:Urease accessory protein UreD n=1 Tax=Minwuia thermotolerans TaxID=2056226 RepID=A0A2M9G3G7_9PROT|nr:urease accessory protein UreD [Minwuia thermotolerans]PJK30253.1 urease accessory protein [Minwuia thermotolerans]